MKLARFFESATRDSGATYVRMVDDAPEWLTDAVRAAHLGDLPNDWIYEQCRDVCDAIDEGSISDSDSVSVWADGRADIYTHDLYAFAKDMFHTYTFSNGEELARDVGGDNDRGSISEQIGRVQYFAIETIAQAILSAFEEHSADDDDDDDENEAT